MKRSSSPHSLPFSVRFIHGQRCLCMSGYAVSSQFVIRELVIAIERENEHDLSLGSLKRLDLVFTRDYLNQHMARILDECDARSAKILEANCFIINEEMVWRARYESYLLAIDWKYKWPDHNVLELFLHRVALFGVAQEETMDIVYHFIECVNRYLNESLNEPAEVMQFKDNCLSINFFRLMLDGVLISAGYAMPRVEGGGFKCYSESGDVYFIYSDEDTFSIRSQEEQLPPMVDVFDWMDGDLAFVNALNDAFDVSEGEQACHIARRHPKTPNDSNCSCPKRLFNDEIDWSSDASQPSDDLPADVLLSWEMSRPKIEQDDALVAHKDSQPSPVSGVNLVSLSNQVIGDENPFLENLPIGKLRLEDAQSESSLLPMDAYTLNSSASNDPAKVVLKSSLGLNQVASGGGDACGDVVTTASSDFVASEGQIVSSGGISKPKKKYSKEEVAQQLSELSKALAERDAQSLTIHSSESSSEQLKKAVSKIEFSLEADADDAVFFKKERDGREMWLSSTYMSEELPHVVEVHNMLRTGTAMTANVAVEALLEVRKHFASPIYVAMLYIIHFNAPELDDVLKLSALCVRSSVSDPLLREILVDIYTRQGNDTLLLELYQRTYQYYEGCPHKMIAIGINIAHVMAVNMGLCAAAIKRLDALRQLVLRYGSVDEKVQFAWAYHIGQGTGTAINYLRQFMTQTNQPDEIAQYGYTIARMMLDHNEPNQMVIHACRSVLDASPNHLPTFKILIRCLEEAKRYEDAAFYAERFMELREPSLDLCRARQRLVGDEGSVAAFKEIRAELIEMARTRERLYTRLDRDASLCIVLKQHLRLEPESYAVFSQLLSQLETIEAYEEMVSISLDFLRDNSSKLSIADELSVRLTLHRICEQRLHLPEEADRHLARAREIAAMDPRVIYAEIDQCRRRGKTNDIIGLRRSLIDVLPPDEAVEQTLLLIQNYEDANVATNVIIEALRKALRLVPDSVPVLLELRRYLRKEKRYYELASVLEKLFPLTKDLTSRKSLLFEASEAHQHLCNDRRAEELYNEAQLLNPIDPNSKSKFMPPYVPLPSEIRKRNEVSREDSLFVNDGYSNTETSNELEPVLTGVDDFNLYDILNESNNEQIARSMNYALESSLEKEDVSANSLNKAQAVSVNSVLPYDSDLPLAERISRARLSGDTKRLLQCLTESQEGLKEEACDPRVLQEIGCIYLYELNDPEKARSWIERAANLSEEVAKGEQTLNALEEIYQALHDYEALAQVYETKRANTTFINERRKASLLLAQVCYEHLNQTPRAIDILEELQSNAPSNEASLRLLAQMYMDTHQYAQALKHLNAITDLLVPDSRKLAQHIVRMVGLYMEMGNTDMAKKHLRDLLNHNDHVDKLAVIEQYKRICRMHDDWVDLLDILQDELCYYLNIPRDDFSLDAFICAENPDIPVGYAIHTLREYADVLYNKIGDIEGAARLYQLIAVVNPKDSYSFNMLCEMLHTHPENEIALKALITVCYPPFSYHVSCDKTKTGTKVMTGKCVSEADKTAFTVIAHAFEKHQSGHIEEANNDLERLLSEQHKYIYLEDIHEVINILKEYWKVTEPATSEHVSHETLEE